MRLSEQDRAVLRDNVSDLVWIWALRLTDAGAVPQPPASAGPTDERTRACGELARLAAIEEIQRNLTELARRAAEEAALYGATYPEVGEAAGISRQAARRRWPTVARIIRWRRPPRRRDVAEEIARFKTVITDGWY
jgi:hypothetical protein